MMVICFRAKLNFFHLNALLILLLLALFFLSLVLEFTKVHNATDWRVSAGRNLNEVETASFSHFKGLIHGDNAHILVIVINKAHFTSANLIIDAVI